MTRLLSSMLALTLALTGCATAATAIRTQATWVCRYRVADYPGVAQALPRDEDPAKVIRAADLAYIRKRYPSVDDKSLTPARAALRAFTQAEAEHATCAVQKVTVKGAKAEATVMTTYPRVGSGRDVVVAVLPLKSDAKRLAEARKLVGKARRGRPHTVVLHFVKTAAGWRADLGLPEKVARKKKQDEAFDCTRRSFAVAKWEVATGRFDRASALVKKWRACRKTYVATGGDPRDLEEQAKQVARLDAAIHDKAVPGQWTYKEVVDEADGTITTHLALQDAGDFEHDLPGLELDCHKGEPKLTFHPGRTPFADPPAPEPSPDAWDHPGHPPADAWHRDFLLHRFWYLPVKEQLDDAKPAAVQGVVKDSEPDVILPATKALVDELRGTTRFHLGWKASVADAYDAPPHDVDAATTFDVRGMQDKLDRFWSRCGVATKLADAIAHRPPKWTPMERVNPKDGTTVTSLKLYARPHILLGSGGPLLELRCQAHRPEVLFEPRGNTSILGDPNDLPVLAKFDDAKPVEIKASAATTEAPWRLPHPKALIEKLRRTRRLALQWSISGYADAHMSPYSRAATVFDVHGLDQVLGDFWAHCGRRAKAKRHPRHHRR